MTKAAATRSKEDNIRELKRLQAMYARLPPDKQKAARPHMQKRIDELQDAIQGRKPKNAEGLSGLQTALLVLLAAVVAVGIGFFGVTYFAQS